MGSTAAEYDTLATVLVEKLLSADKIHRPCGKSSTRGTVIHGTKVNIGKWKMAAYLLASDPKIKSRELGDACRVSYKTAWRMRSVLKDLVQTV